MDAVVALQAADPGFFWSPKISIQDVTGQGKSVVCTDRLAAGEVVIRVPRALLVNLDTVENIEELETHELLALELLRRREKSDPWVEAMPADFSFLPVQWPDATVEQLPSRYRAIVAQQSKSMQQFVSKCNLDPRDACWAWLAVNSRCLYWANGGMTLAPAIDFLNHAADEALGLAVKTTPLGMTVSTTRSYDPLSELTFSYGPRENGFLLVEYGFTLTHNPWDFVDLSDFIGPLVNECQSFLEAHGYYGDYTLDAEGEPSFRIEVALAAAQAAPVFGPVKALINGFDDGRRFRSQTMEMVGRAAKMALQKALNTYALAEDSAEGQQIKILYDRYIHILRKAVEQ